MEAPNTAAMETTSMFSTLTLTSDDIPNPITLVRTEDFPSHQFDWEEGAYHSKPAWQSSWYPESAGHLSLRLTERLNGGRSAVAYAAEVLPGDAIEAGVASSTPTPPEQELCVKVARFNRCRTLAREAWMYNRLRRRVPGGREMSPYDQLPSGERLQGVIAPCFYGFFTARMLPGQFPSWSTDDSELESDSDEDSESTPDDNIPDDYLPDDQTLLEGDFWHDHGLGGRERSTWCKWCPDPSAPLLAVIVMSRGGPTYTREDHSDPATQADIRAILSDLSMASLVHRDLRPPNIVRAPPSTIPCERHNCIHKWNVIDFSMACIDDYDVENAEKEQTHDWYSKQAVHSFQNYSYRETDSFFYR